MEAKMKTEDILLEMMGGGEPLSHSVYKLAEKLHEQQQEINQLKLDNFELKTVLNRNLTEQWKYIAELEQRIGK